MIKNIVFDMGQVLIHFDRERFIDRIGITDPADRDILMREVYLTVEWALMDRGALTEAQAIEIMKKRVPERLHEAVRLLTADWPNPLMPMEGMAELIAELKENGYKIYLLSNASHMQKEYWHDIPGSEYFDGRVVSAEEGYVKPQTEIYKILCDRYNLVPEECVFIDDAVSNCEGAVFYGINAIVFHGSARETRERLAELGVIVSA